MAERVWPAPRHPCGSSHFPPCAWTGTQTRAHKKASLRSGLIMKDAFGSQTQELLSIVPPRCRIPLTREPPPNGSPPPHCKPSCRRRNTVGHSAARCTNDNSVLCPRACRACHAHCFVAGCQISCAPAGHAVLAPGPTASFTPAPHSATVVFDQARAERNSNSTAQQRPATCTHPHQGPI